MAGLEADSAVHASEQITDNTRSFGKVAGKFASKFLPVAFAGGAVYQTGSLKYRSYLNAQEIRSDDSLSAELRRRLLGANKYAADNLVEGSLASTFDPTFIIGTAYYNNRASRSERWYEKVYDTHRDEFNALGLTFGAYAFPDITPKTILQDLLSYFNVDLIPDSKEGQPEALHNLILLKQDIASLQEQYDDLAVIGPGLLPSQEEEMERLSEKLSKFYLYMEGDFKDFFEDPNNLEIAVGLIPAADRVRLLDRILRTPSHRENLAETHLEVAKYVEQSQGVLGMFTKAINPGALIEGHSDVFNKFIIEQVRDIVAADRLLEAQITQNSKNSASHATVTAKLDH